MLLEQLVPVAHVCACVYLPRKSGGTAFGV